VHLSGKRVRRLLRREGCWRPSRFRGRRRPHPMTARSSRRAPNQRRHHGLDPSCWLGVGVRLGGPLPRRGLGPCGKVGDRFAALQPVSDAVIDRWPPGG
jgi:hypothetical protein